MKVLEEGKAHKRDIMVATCNFCESSIRIIYGDPRSDRKWYGHDGVEYILKFKCPVCGQISELHTNHDHSKDQFVLKKDAFLSIEDKKEIESWEDDPLMDLTDDDLIILRALDHARRIRIKLGIIADPDDEF